VQKTEDFYKRDNERVRAHFSGLRDLGVGAAAPQSVKHEWYNAGGNQKGNENIGKTPSFGGGAVGYGGGSSNINDNGPDDRNEMMKKLQD